MSSLIQRAVCGSLVALSLLGFGCGDERASLVLRGVVIGRQDEATKLCTYDGTLTQPMASGGIVYSSYQSYYRVLLVQNQLAASANAQEYRPETNSAVIKDAEITVRTVTGALISKFKLPVTGLVDPGGVSTLVTVTLLDTVAMKQLVDSKVSDALVYVKLNAETKAGTALASGDQFFFPIRVGSYVAPVFDAGTVSAAGDGGAPPVIPVAVAPTSQPDCL